jgi:CBS domain containing-hemolysin-like protein
MSTTRLLADIVQPKTQSRYMVVDNGQLVGMISLKDLLELISLKLEIDSGSQ